MSRCWNVLNAQNGPITSPSKGRSVCLEVMTNEEGKALPGLRWGTHLYGDSAVWAAQIPRWLYLWLRSKESLHQVGRAPRVEPEVMA